MLRRSINISINTDKEVEMQLIKWIKSLFVDVSYQDEVESFVISKNPTTTAEVEYWIRVYDQRQKHWAF